MGIDQILLEYAGKGAGSLALLIIGWIGSAKGVKKIKSLLNPPDVYAELAIQTALNELKIKTGAAHTWLAQYTNGKQSFGSFCFKYFHIIADSPASGREKIKAHYRNIPADYYTDFRKALQESDQFFVWTLETDYETPVPYYAHGIKKAFEWKLKNNDVNIGHVALCFDEETELTEVMKEHLKNYTKTIKSLIKLTKK